MEKLTSVQISEMLVFTTEVFAGTKTTTQFFEKWPDISKDEDADVRELWFSMSYYESDKHALPESAEIYRNSALRYAERLNTSIQK